MRDQHSMSASRFAVLLGPGQIDHVVFDAVLGKWQSYEGSTEDTVYGDSHSNSRPRISNDNAYSESLFITEILSQLSPKLCFPEEG